MALQISKPMLFNKNLHPLDSFFGEARKQAILRKSLQNNVLREAFKQLRADFDRGRKDGINPLEMFPKEIWKMISEYLDESLDLINWTRTCTLFLQLVNMPPVELLFAKIIPLISTDFTHKDVLTCRLVCRSWRKGTDEFVLKFWDTRFHCENSENTVEKLRVERSEFMIDDEEMEKIEASLDLPKLDNASIELQANSLWHGFANVQLEIEHPDFLQAYKKDLNKIGNYLKHLEIDDGDDDDDDDPDDQDEHAEQHAEHEEENAKLAANDLSLLCQQSLEACPELKSFTVHDCKSVNWDNGKQITVPSFTQLPSLQFLGFLIKNEASSVILDQFLRAYSGQLKSFHVENWNVSLYHTLTWNYLTKLTIEQVSSNRILQSLAKTNAPNLLVLGLTLIGSIQLGEVLRTVQNFQKLRCLDLVFLNRQFYLWASEVPELSTNLATCVHILNIYTGAHTIDFDFLVFFPLVKKLDLNLKAFKDSELPSVKNNVHAKNNFIRFRECLNTTLKNELYNSNLWTMFPQLEELEVSGKRWTRQHYNWNQLTSTQRLQQLLKIVHTHAKQHDRRNSRKMQTEMPKEMASRAQLAQIVTTRGQRVGPNDIFEMLFPFLDKAAILQCRKICKVWRNTIDIILSKSPTPSFIQQLVLPFLESRRGEIEKRLEAMNPHPSNALVGKSVKIILSLSGNDPTPVQLLLDADLLFSKIGRHITHLQITSSENRLLDIKSLYELLIQAFRHCLNLVSLDLQALKISNKPLGTDTFTLFDSTIIMTQRQFTTFLAGRHPPCFDEIQYEILNRFKWQLTILQLSSRRNAYNSRCNYNLARLEEIGQPVDEPREESPTRLLTLNVAKLQLFIDSAWEHGWLYTNNMLYVMKNYPKLCALELYFSDNCQGTSFNDVTYMNPHEIFKVSTLRIVVRNKYQISFDFLVRFPLLRKLEIMIGDWAADWHNVGVVEPGKTEWQSHLDAPDGQRNDASDPEEPISLINNGRDKDERENELIPLAKYIWDQKENQDINQPSVYDSNIWTVLPKLQKLEISQEKCNDGTKPFTRVYTKAQYEYHNLHK